MPMVLLHLPNLLDLGLEYYAQIDLILLVIHTSLVQPLEEVAKLQTITQPYLGSPC